MELSDLEQICLSLPATEQEIKWKSDLVFMVARKMFCVVDLDAVPLAVAFKVSEQDFEELIALPLFKPAPYFAKHHWVTVLDISKLGKRQWESHLKGSYELVKAKLSAKARRDFKIE